MSRRSLSLGLLAACFSLIFTGSGAEAQFRGRVNSGQSCPNGQCGSCVILGVPEGTVVYSPAPAAAAKIVAETKGSLDPATFKYPRGYRLPSAEKLAARHARAKEEHGDLVARLPFFSGDSLDLRSLGIIPEIKDQADCGSCHIFSAAGTASIALRKALWPVGEGLSEQCMLDCAPELGGCNGGDEYDDTLWIAAHGLPLESDYGPYVARRQSCKKSSKMYGIGESQISIVFCTPGQENGMAGVNDVKKVLANLGAVSTAVAADSDWDRVPADGVLRGGAGYQPRHCNHAVIIVGFKDDPSLPAGGAFLVRNSWSKSFAQVGYVWVPYGRYAVGTEAFTVTARPAISPAPAVTVTSLAPPSGPAGTVVTLTGSGFTEKAGVKFGTSPATTVTYVSATTLKATAPMPCSTCSKNVDVTVNVGDVVSPVVSAAKFTYTTSPIPPAVMLGTMVLEGTGTSLDGRRLELVPEGTRAAWKKAAIAFQEAAALIEPVPPETPEPPLSSVEQRLDLLERTCRKILEKLGN